MEDSPVVNMARNEATLTVRVPVYSDTPIDLTVEQETAPAIGIHICCRQGVSKNAPQAYMQIPKVLTGKARGRDHTLGAAFGVNKAWVAFACDYLGYAVDKWSSHQDAQKWCNHLRKYWLQHVQSLWEYRGGNSNPVNRFWRVGKSKVEPDTTYIANGWFSGRHSMSNPGSGLFCTRKGSHVIHVKTDWMGTERVASNRLADEQGPFAMADETQEWQFTPTVRAIKCGCVHFAYIMQHSKRNPTHQLDWDKDTKNPYFTPLREAAVGEEFTYDYRYELSREIHAMAALTAAVDVVLTETPTSNTLEVNPKLEV